MALRCLLLFRKKENWKILFLFLKTNKNNKNVAVLLRALIIQKVYAGVTETSFWLPKKKKKKPRRK